MYMDLVMNITLYNSDIFEYISWMLSYECKTEWTRKN